MKTIEEMKSVVIAYCEEVCPQIKNEYFPLGATDDGARALYLRKSATFFNDPKTAYHVLCCKGQEHVLSKETLASASDETVMLFYRLLGLAERDAVAEKGQQCRQMIEATISAANAKINALEARNTALVVALEGIKKPWYVFKLGKRTSLKSTLEQYKTRCMAIQDIASRAIRVNTEKGGQNG